MKTNENNRNGPVPEFQDDRLRNNQSFQREVSPKVYASRISSKEVEAIANEDPVYAIGISPSHCKSDKEVILKQATLLLLQDASPSERIEVFDALNCKRIAEFMIPNKAQTPIARLERMKAPLAALKAFLIAEQNHPTNLNDAIDFPKFLSFISTYVRKTNEPLTIILIGDAIYRNKKDPSLNFDGAYPSPGHLIIDEQASVWGTKNKKSALAGVTVHFAYMADRFVNSQHEQQVKRFYHLFLREQKGTLATFAPDIELAFRRVKEKVREPVTAIEVDSEDSGLFMHEVVQQPVPKPPKVAATVEPAPQAQPPSPRPQILTKTNIVTVTNTVTKVETIYKDGPTSPDDKKIGIAISWKLSPKIDLDLWVRPFPGAQELSHKRISSLEGRYFRDNRKGGIECEYVELESADIRPVECWVNFFSGRSSSAGGEITIYYNGRTYHRSFEFSAKVGNAGFGSNNRSKNNNWVRLDLLSIIGEKNLGAQK